MNCPDCNHDEHQPGRCENCNCGQSETSNAQTKPNQKRAALHGAYHRSQGALEQMIDCGRLVPKRKTD